MTVATPVTSSAILLIYCQDGPGIIASVSDFIHRHGGNILTLDQYVDPNDAMFFMRVEWDIQAFTLSRSVMADQFTSLVGRRFGMRFELHFSDEVPRMAVFVSRLSHCFYDILSRCRSGEWRVEVPLVISNHRDLEGAARHFGVDYHYFPVDEHNREEREAAERELLKKHRVDFVVLARYMRVLGPAFVQSFPNRIINIHHSFLPAFPGSKPYHSAHERGVKIIGATSHYVTEELDAGPIIEQDVAPITHKDTIEDLIRKGRDLEKVVLARAVRHHLMRHTLVCKNRTIVFS